MNLEEFNSPEFLEKLKNASSPQELFKLAKEAGLELSNEQLQAASAGVTWDCWDISGCLDVCSQYKSPEKWCPGLFM